MAAKYRDPATQLPFYNKNAFRTIREAYYHYLEEKGNRNDPQVINVNLFRWSLIYDLRCLLTLKKKPMVQRAIFCVLSENTAFFQIIA